MIAMRVRIAVAAVIALGIGKFQAATVPEAVELSAAPAAVEARLAPVAREVLPATVVLEVVEAPAVVVGAGEQFGISAETMIEEK
jgi:hypothetical protein